MSQTLKLNFNKTTEFTVYGWFRQINTYELNIPYVIQHLVATYFRICDQFIHDIWGKCCIDHNGMRVTTSPLQQSGNCRFNGDIQIQTNQFVQWKFQIEQFGRKNCPPWNIHFMSFGLKVHCKSTEEHGRWSVKTIQKIQGEWQRGKWKNGKRQNGKWTVKDLYYYTCEIEECYNNEEEGFYQEEQDQRVLWKEGDTLTMQYNHGKLSYQVNNNESYSIFNMPYNFSTFEYFKLYANIPYDSKVKMSQFYIE